MGRSRNKSSRSTGGGIPKATPSAGSGLRRDTGLPNYFKQRRQADSIAVARQQLGLPPNVLSANGEMERKDGTAALSTSEPDGDDCAASTTTTSAFERVSRDLTLSGRRDNSAKAFMREVKNVIENSDVMLEVLDARDPLGSRSRQTERMAMEHGKKVVLILNKVDLIPTANLQAWLRYLRNDFPTLAFKSSTQQQRSNLKQGKGTVDLPKGGGGGGGKGEKQLSFGSEAIGATALLQLLKNYARTAIKGSSLKQQLSVGVVGPPNVGKSSLINSLLRTRACAVASTPGWTKVVQGVMLEKGIRLLDCPGVVLGGSNEAEDDDDDDDVDDDDNNNNNNNEATTDGKHDAAWSVLRNTVKVELIEDPIAPVQAMLARVDADQLTKLYSIDGGFNEGDAHDFLLRVALLRGKLGKGGVPDLEGAARIVLHDWNVGRIAFHSTPPAVHRSMRKGGEVAAAAAAKENGSATGADTNRLTAGSSLVSGFGEAFDLDALLGDADAELLGSKDLVGGGPAINGPLAGRPGKDLLTPRERVYAADKVVKDEAIEEDEEGKTALAESAPHALANLDAADTSRSSLGKRRRGMDEMAPSEEDDDDDDDDDDDASSNDGRNSHDKVRSKLQPAADDAIAEDDLAIPTPASPRGRPFELRDPHVNGSAMKRETILSRQQRELQRAMGESEVAGMARRRGDVRRAAKKDQKRLRKSGAGLVDAMTSALALQGDDESQKTSDNPRRKAVKSHAMKTSPTLVRRGLFDVLDVAQQPAPAAVEEEEEEL